MELIKRAKRLLYKALLASNKERKGFTLPEVVAVVAITATLAAIVVPVAVDQIEKGRQARAMMDVDGISQGLSGFYRDTGVWPVRVNATTPKGIEVLRSGNTTATFDLFASETVAEASGNAEDPGEGLTDWSAATGMADALVNHITLDESDYEAAGVNWNGPYLPQIFNDPWGRNYLVYAKAFTDPENTAGADIYVWVISGGPNETLETNVTSPIINDKPDDTRSTVSDDIGKMMFKARTGVLGVQ